ncbi:MAG: YfiR family protein [Candidatus Polarisedimenticolia bacterium]
MKDRALSAPVALLLVAAGSALLAAPPPPIERPAPGAFGQYQVKAAFLFNFMKFVEWPPGAIPTGGAPWTLCLLGHDPFHGALEETVRGRTAGGRACEIRRVAAAAELPGCHLLFASLYEDDTIGAILARVASRPILTAGETDRFEHAGGMIRFVVEGDRVRFVVNAGAARHAGVKISSKLLSLARSVKGLEGRRDR